MTQSYSIGQNKKQINKIKDGKFILTFAKQIVNGHQILSNMETKRRNIAI